MPVTVNNKSPIQDYVHPDDLTNLLISLVSYLLAFFENWPYFVLDSVQFSSVHFYLAKINYNTRIHIRIVSWQGSPEETRRLMKAGLPSHEEISKV